VFSLSSSEEGAVASVTSRAASSISKCLCGVDVAVALVSLSSLVTWKGFAGR